MDAEQSQFFDLYCRDGSVELRLGPARQWTRMLRAQDRNWHQIPGFRGCSSAAGGSWQLEEWRFERFASRHEPDAAAPDRNGAGQEWYYAQGLYELADSTGPRPVSHLPAESLLHADFLTALSGFVEALCVRYEKLGYKLPGIVLDGLLYRCFAPIQGQASQQFLLLPPELLYFVAQRSSAEARLDALLPFQTPVSEAPDRQRWVYALAALCYRKLCGEFPFDIAKDTAAGQTTGSAKHKAALLRDASPGALGTEERLHDARVAMSRGQFLRAQLFRPELSDAWDELLRRSLCDTGQRPPNGKDANRGKGNKGPVTLRDWQAFAKTGGLWRECSDEQRSTAARELLIERRKREQSRKRGRFWRKKRGLVAVYSILALVLVSVLYTPLKRALSPPPHNGLSALETARLYYQAIDQLDPQLHGELTFRGEQVVKADGNLLTMLFVNTRTRQGYEGHDVVLRAGDWLTGQGLSAKPDSPLPALSLDVVLYGITGLELEELSATVALRDGEQRRLRAVYDFWLPGSFGSKSAESPEGKAAAAGDEPQAFQPLHQHNEDLLTLLYRARKKAWFVHRIERHSELVVHPLSE